MTPTLEAQLDALGVRKPPAHAPIQWPVKLVERDKSKNFEADGTPRF